MNYELRIKNWVRILCVLLCLCAGELSAQTNTAIMLRGANLLPSNAAGVISNALSLGPFATNTNLVMTNIDGLQTALDGKLATNGILPSYTNVAGLQSWVTNINAPLFLSVGTTAGTVAAGDDARITNAVQQGGVGSFSQLRTSDESVMLGNGANADSGGGAVGSDANAIYGGGVVGYNAKAFYGGGAVGSDAHADYGGAVGYGADSSDNLISGTGFAGGYNAKAKGPNRVQLGTGINATDGTMQFLSFPLVAADGKIPVERLPDWVNTNPATVRTNIGLGATNSVTFAGLTNTGDTTLGDAAGDSVTVNAGSFTAPNATATNANSVMTRDLVDMEPLYSIGQVFRGGPLSYGSANGGSAIARDLDRLAMASSSTNAASYGRISIQRGLTTVSAMSGVGINFSKTLAISTRVAVSFQDTNAVVRLVVGANGGTPSMADAAPLAAVGFGWEASRATSGLAKFRAFAHDGTNITYSGWTTGQYYDLYPQAVVISSSGGTVTLQVAPVLSRTFETVTTTGGPTTMGAFANAFVDLYAASPTATGEVAQVALMDAIFSTK